MKCLRCGRCCFYAVVIIRPEAVKEDLNIDALHEEDLKFLNNEKCPHLSWDNDVAICAIHHYLWFKDTPCGQYTQIERSADTSCRTGVWMQKNPEAGKHLTMRGDK